MGKIISGTKFARLTIGQNSSLFALFLMSITPREQSKSTYIISSFSVLWKTKAGPHPPTFLAAAAITSV